MWLTRFGSRKIGGREKVKSNVSVLGVWGYHYAIYDNGEIERKLPYGEKNNDFFPHIY